MARTKVLGRGLILSFQYIDAAFFIEENQRVREALERVGFAVKELFVDSDNFENDLTSFLDGKDKPRFIYVNGHGEDRGNELVLSR